MQLKVTLLFLLFLGCEDKIEKLEYVECEWFQIAETESNYCEDIYWCDETQYQGEIIRVADIYYIG